MSTSENPQGVANFLVSIEGMAQMDFAECILPTTTIEVIEYRQGSDAVDNVHKLPGLVKYGNLVLKRGISTTGTPLALFSWFSAFAQGTGSPAAITVTLLDRARNPLFKWSFSNCWPVRYELPALNAKNSAVAIETLEIAVEGMQFTA